MLGDHTSQNTPQNSQQPIDEVQSLRARVRELEAALASAPDSASPNSRAERLHSSDRKEQERTEQALYECEARYRTLFESTSDAIVVMDLSGAVLSVNPAACVLFGYTEEEFRLLDRDAMLDASGPHLTALLKERHGTSYLPAELTYKRKGGMRFTGEVTMTFFENDQGERRAVEIIRDITGRKRVEEEIKQLYHDLEGQVAEVESERLRWKAMVEGIADEVWICDAQGHVTLLNAPQAANMDLVESENKTVHEIYDKAEFLTPDGQLRPFDEAPLLRALRTGNPVRGEEIMRQTLTGQTRYRHFSAAPMRDATGAITGAIAIVRDITREKQVEETLRQSEARLRAVFGSLAEGIVFLNAQGEVEQVNDAVERFHGHTLKELADPMLDPRGQIIRPDGTPFPVDEQPAIVALRTGEPVRDIEMGVPTRDGQVRWRLVNAQPVRDDRGNRLGAVASFFDITDRRRAEEQIRALNREMQDRAQDLENANDELRVANEQLRVGNVELQKEIARRKSVEKSLLQATRALGVSEERFRFALANSPIFVANMDRALRYTWLYNPIGGYKTTDVVGKPFGESFEAESREKSYRLLQAVVTRGTSAQWESTSHTADGSKFFDLHAEPLRDARGEITGVALVSIDITERKRAEIELAWLASFPQRNPHPISELDQTGSIYYLNPSAQKLFPDLKERGLAHPWFAEWESVVKEFHARQVTTSQREVRIGESWYLQTLSLLPETGRVRIYATDITERRRAEQELARQQSLLSEAEKLSHTGAWEWDLTRDQWTFSDEWLSIHGCTQRMLTPDELLAIAHPDDRRAVAQAFEDVRQGKPYDIEHRIVRQDTGQERVVRASGQSVVDSTGTITRVYGFVQDITERMRAEEQMRLQVTALESAGEAIVIVAADGAIQWANPAFTRLTGYTFKEAIGNNPRIFKSGQHDSAFYKRLWTTILAGRIWHGELVNKKKDGTLYTEEMTIAPVSNRDGVLTHYIAIKQDITERRQAEDKLRVSEERLRVAVKNAAFIPAQVDRNLRYVWIYNPHPDFDPALVIGKTDLEVEDSEGSRRLTALKQSVLQHGVGAREEIKFVRTDGTRVYDILAEPITGTDGVVTGVLTAAFDITNRWLAEEALREAHQAASQSEARLRTVLEQLPLGVTIQDAASGQVTVVNEEARRILGTLVHTLQHAASYEAVHPDGRPYRNEEWPVSRALAHGETVQGEEMELRGTDGSRVVIRSNAAPIRDPDGRIIAGVTVFDDVTERKRAEKALHETMQKLRLSEQRFRTALKHAPILVYNQDLDLNYTWVFNRWGLDSTDLAGKAGEQIIPSYGPELDALKRRVMETGTGTRREIRGVGLDVREHVYDFNIDPLRDDSGGIIGVTCASIDVTEYKNAAARIQQLNSELEHRAVELEVANKELESFTYSVSHDLRTPLATIDSLAKMLQDDNGCEMPEAQHQLNLIRTGTRQMEELIQSLLRLSRLTRHALKKQDVNMTALVMQALETVQSEPGREDLTLDIRELTNIQADPVLLKQVWVNLIANALKFTRKCGNARIEIGCGPCDGEERVFYVRDNGVGFDMDQAERLFGVFQRLHAEDEYEGTGVGLALVQRIVHRHGGRVWAEARVNEGATFYFTLGENHAAG